MLPTVNAASPQSVSLAKPTAATQAVESGLPILEAGQQPATPFQLEFESLLNLDLATAEPQNVAVAMADSDAMALAEQPVQAETLLADGPLSTTGGALAAAAIPQQPTEDNAGVALTDEPTELLLGSATANGEEATVDRMESSEARPSEQHSETTEIGEFPSSDSAFFQNAVHASTTAASTSPQTPTHAKTATESTTVEAQTNITLEGEEVSRPLASADNAAANRSSSLPADTPSATDPVPAPDPSTAPAMHTEEAQVDLPAGSDIDTSAVENLGTIEDAGSATPTSDTASIETSRTGSRPSAAVAGSVTKQVSEHVVRASQTVEAGHTKLEVTLDPPELGKITIELTSGDDQQISAKLIVSEAATLETLRDTGQNILDTLAEAGLSLGDFQLESSTPHDQHPSQDENAQVVVQGPGDDNASSSDSAVPIHRNSNSVNLLI